MAVAIDSTMYDEYLTTPDTISDINSDPDDYNLDIDTSDIVNDVFVDDTQNQLFYQVPFDSNTEFLFVNHMLSLLHGRLPSYVYYPSNNGLRYQFWNNLTLNEFSRVYHYLFHNGFIESTLSDNGTGQHDMRNQVFTFIDSYFVSEEYMDQDQDYDYDYMNLNIV
jgi:hypothetical protein